MAGIPVVQVLGGRAHDQRRGVDQLLGDDPRVGVDLLAHRVPPHVLDAAGDRHVVGAEGDAGGGGGDRGHRAGAHPVDGEAGHRAWQSGEQRRRAADGQALVADLGGGRDRHLVHPLGRQLGMAAEQFADAVDRPGRRRGSRHRCEPALPNGVRTPSTKTTSREGRGMVAILLTSNKICGRLDPWHAAAGFLLTPPYADGGSGRRGVISGTAIWRCQERAPWSARKASTDPSSIRGGGVQARRRR